MAIGSLAFSGQLSLGRDAHLHAYMADLLGTAGVPKPIAAADPAASGASGSCLKCEVIGAGTGTTIRSRARWSFSKKVTTEDAVGMDEVYIGVDVCKEYDALEFVLKYIVLHRVDTSTLVNIQDLTGISQVSFGGGNTMTNPFPPNNVWSRAKIYYKAATVAGNDGKLIVTVDGSAGVDITHNNQIPLGGFQLMAEQSSTIAGAGHTGNDHSVFFRKLAWGPTDGDDVWVDQSLTFGAQGSKSDPTKIDVVQHLDIDPVHFTAAELTTAGGADITWNYRLVGAGSWTTFATDTAQTPDAHGEYIHTKVITGLNENADYEFQAVFGPNDDSVSDVTTSTIALTTLSASSGTPATLTIAAFSCNDYGHLMPYEGLDTLRSFSPQMFFELGDFVYQDRTRNGILLEPAGTDEVSQTLMRTHARAQLDNTELRRLLQSCGAHIQPDDHDVDVSSSRQFGGGMPGASFAESWDALCGNRRLNPFGAGRFEIEGLGMGQATARTLFICLDSRTPKVNTASTVFSDVITTTGITAITTTAGVATVTCDGTHDLAIGCGVDITGSNVAAYNGRYRVATVPTTSTYTFAKSGSPGAANTGTSTQFLQRWGRTAFTEGGATSQLDELDIVIAAHPKPMIVVMDGYPIGRTNQIGFTENVDSRSVYVDERSAIVSSIRATNPRSLIVFVTAERHQVAVFRWTENGEEFTEFCVSPISGSGVSQEFLPIDPPGSHIDLTGNTVLIQANALATAPVVTVPLASVSNVDPYVFTTTGVHGLDTKDTILFEGMAGMTSLEGLYDEVDMLSTTTFSLRNFANADHPYAASTGTIIPTDRNENSAFTLLTINEAAVTIQMDAINGHTGDVMYTATLSALKTTISSSTISGLAIGVGFD